MPCRPLTGPVLSAGGGLTRSRLSFAKWSNSTESTRAMGHPRMHASRPGTSTKTRSHRARSVRPLSSDLSPPRANSRAREGSRRRPPFRTMRAAPSRAGALGKSVGQRSWEVQSLCLSAEPLCKGFAARVSLGKSLRSLVDSQRSRAGSRRKGFGQRSSRVDSLRSRAGFLRDAVESRSPSVNWPRSRASAFRKGVR